MKVMAGIDLHSNNAMVGLMDEEGRRLGHQKLECDLKKVVEFLSPYKEQLASVVVESTYNWYWLVDGLKAQGFPVVLANPAKIEQYSGIKHADDKNDRFLRRHLGERTWRAGERPALRRLLNILRKTGVTPQAKGIPSTPAQRLAADYRRYLSEERGCAGCTLENYGRHIDRFVVQRFGTGSLKPSRLQARDVVEFVQRNARLHSRGHTLQVVTALRSFLRFMHYRGHITSDLAQAVPAVAHWRMADLPKHLPAAAVQKVLDSCDRATAVGRRNYAILLLLARLGLRGGEIIALQLEDIDWDNAQLTIRSKKGRGWARLPLPKDVGKAIAQYLQIDRPHCSSRNVFVRMVAPYERLSNSPVISVLVRNALGKAGVQSVRKGAHLFRHSLATEMLRQGASLDEIGQVLRHQDPDTTALYAKVDLDALRRLAVAWPGGVQ